MKKKLVLLGLCFLVFLSGCSHKKPEAAHRVVSRVEISCTQSGVSRQLTYREPQKIEAVLNYLRCLHYKGKAHINPEKLPGDSYRITLVNTDGTSRIYRQQAFSYLCRNSDSWEKIDPKRGKYLWLLLKLMPAD